ncbi:MAG: hypothetical protein JXA96_12660 [Sedimentisphaerales bacterium]|nr:hypothetical protein [Sedimentisphaerales bacterium]
MKRINGLLVLLAISSLFKTFGEVHYFSIDSLPGLSAVDLDYNKSIDLMGRAQQQHPYDSNSNDFNPDFNADFAFSFGNLDPSCGGQLFLTYFQSYHVSDINEIDTLHIEKMPRIDSIVEGEGFGPYFEINYFYTCEYGNSLYIAPDYPLNKFYLIKTNNKRFALLRIRSYIYGSFDPSELCNHIIAIKIEWWVQDDGNYDKLSQIVDVNYIKRYELNNIDIIIINNNNKIEFDLIGRKCLKSISTGLSIIKNHRNNKNSSIIHFHGYQK